MQTTRDGNELFREAALRAHFGSRASHGDLLRLSSEWTNWIYWLLIALCCVGFTYLVLGRVNEYAAGTVIVRGEDRADVKAISGGTITDIAVKPGERVAAGQLLLRLYDAREAAELARLNREYELQLARALNSPNELTAQQQLAFTREQLQTMAARLEERHVTAPRAGTIKDLRIRTGQLVSPGELLLSLAGDEDGLSVVALLPGHYRPLLRPGAPLRVELNGFSYAYQHLTIDSVGEEVIGPAEARKYLGPEIADTFTLQGSVVIVTARLPSRTFQSGDNEYILHDGLQGTAEARVRSTRLILALFPSLKAVWRSDNE